MESVSMDSNTVDNSDSGVTHGLANAKMEKCVKKIKKIDGKCINNNTVDNSDSGVTHGLVNADCYPRVFLVTHTHVVKSGAFCFPVK